MNVRLHTPFFLLLVILNLGNFPSFAQQSEDDYTDLIHQRLGGEREVGVQSGFVDILTDEHAIEVEFAGKWKQSIGQALWYGLQTGKKPGIVLIKERNYDNKYIIQLGSALQYGDLTQQINVWVWPDDFRGASTTNQPPESYGTPHQRITEKSYWLTTSSKIRHNSSCMYFKKTRGVYCEKEEGVACKKCGG